MWVFIPTVNGQIVVLTLVFPEVRQLVSVKYRNIYTVEGSFIHHSCLQDAVRV